MLNPRAPSPRPHLILASGSPRRRELLHEAGYSFTVMPPDEDVECGVCSESGPAGLVAELAYRKATAVRKKLESEFPPLPISSSPSLILAADTVAELDGFVLGKPRDETDARAMLTQLSSRDHRVLTGVCLIPLPFREGNSDLPLPLGEGRGEGALSPAKRLMPAELLEFARDLRKTQSDAESKMWYLLRDCRLAGFKFRRQHPVMPYVLDFYCHERRLAIELDGGQHNTEQSRRTDEARTRFLMKQGIRVVRFWNHEVFEDMEAVLGAIWNALHNDQDTLTPNPSPKGRGELILPLPPGEGRGEGVPLIRVAVTKLRMDALRQDELDDYIAGGQWEGKAGEFGYQDRLGWVHIVEGSESNVVGLPMELLAEMLAEIGAGSGGQGAGRAE